VTPPTLSQEGINDRIIKEVDALKIPKANKTLLKELLAIELEIYDQAKPHYVEAYKEAFARNLSL
jgi:hypothetical protein